MTTDSEIIHHDGGVTLAGSDATSYFAALHLRGFIELYIKTKMIPTRGVTISRMLKMATEQYTGKKYKNNEAGWTKAVEDIKVWCDTMRAALPETDKRTK